MGLIKAAASAIGGTLHDQWLDAIKCENMDNETLSVKVSASNGNEGAISKGSRIIVNIGQAALIVDNGQIVDACAEPGAYTFDKSTSPSLFAGDFGGMFKEMWERFKYGGGIAKEQAVYFVNTKEIIDNRFGTSSPVPYSDWGHPSVNPRTNSFYGMSVKIKTYGKYTFKIDNPFAFVNVIAGTAQRFTKDNLTEQIASELLSSFRNTLAEMGSENYKIPALDLPHKDDEIISIMNEKNFAKSINDRGIKLITISVEGITFDDESNAKINQYELSDEYTKNAYLAHSQGEALKTAAANTNGAGTTFMGMGMGFGAMGMNPMNQMQNAGGNNVSDSFAASAQKANAAKENTWKCECGAEVNGNFCQNCGKKKPQPSVWKCECGAEVDGNFCQNCGKKKPENGKWDCSCGKKEIEGNFCPNCGKKKD